MDALIFALSLRCSTSRACSKISVAESVSKLSRNQTALHSVSGSAKSNKRLTAAHFRDVAARPGSVFVDTTTKNSPMWKGFRRFVFKGLVSSFSA